MRPTSIFAMAIKANITNFTIDSINWILTLSARKYIYIANSDIECIVSKKLVIIFFG